MIHTERILIFGNTMECRQTAQTMRRRGKQVIVHVTTEYARSLMPAGAICKVGRLDAEQMLAYVRVTNPAKIIDATSPYARTAQKNIRHAADVLGIPCSRVLIQNESEAWRDVVQWVDTPEEAVETLKRSTGNILLAGDYRNLPQYAPHVRPERLYVRGIPSMEALQLCDRCGVLPSHIVAAYGPYTPAFNEAVFDMFKVDVLVMRDVAVGGGMSECVIPALERSLHVIMVRGE